MKAQLLVGSMLLFILFNVSFGWAETTSQTVSLKYTHHFKIEYLGNNCKKLTDAAGNQLLLVPRANKYFGKNSKIPVLYTPVQKVLFTSMTQVCFLRPFNDPQIWDSVVGVTSPLKEWYIPEIRRGLRSGAIQFVGDGYEPNYEAIQTIQPEVVLTYGGLAGQAGLIRKLGELQIPYAVDNDYLETDPLGRLEWIKFIAAFYNKEREAGEYFDRVEKRMLQISGQLQGEPKPRIAWGLIYQGQVYVADGNSYVAKLISMAGGDYVFKNVNTSNAAISIESFYSQTRQADILIYAAFPGNIRSIKSIVNSTPILKGLRAIRLQQVWCFQPWYNQSLDKSDQVLQDLAGIFHPGVIKEQKLQNFHKVPLQYTD